MVALLPMLRRTSLVLLVIAMAAGAGPARAAGRRHHRRHHQRTGKIVVHSLTNGAAILVDGRWVGTVPLKQPLTGLEPGKHKVRVTRLGFMAYDATVVVKPGRTTAVEADLLPFKGVLYLTSNVLGASVKMGKVTVGKTPIRGQEIAAGKHELVVTKDGYQPWRKNLMVIAGQRYKLSASLAPLSPGPPLVALTAPPAAKPKPIAPAPTTTPTPAPTAAIATPPPSKPVAENDPMWHRWWFWAAVGTVVAVAGVGAAASASQGPGTPTCIATPVDGTIGTCRSH